MSWNSLARELHGELCTDLGCAETAPPEAGSYTEHGLNREWWEAVAVDVKAYVVARTRDEWPESIANTLRSHGFPKCELCGAAVDDPEASTYCETGEPVAESPSTD